MSQPKIYPEGEIEAMIEMAAGGMSASQIAKAIGGVSRNAVIGRMHRRGIRFGRVEGRPRIQRTYDAPRIKSDPVVTPSAPLAPDPRNLTLVNAGPRDCKWIEGAPIEEAIICGHRTEVGVSWCPYHLTVVWQGKVPKVPSAPQETA
jgi:GcrA cell cycle regulator